MSASQRGGFWLQERWVRSAVRAYALAVAAATGEPVTAVTFIFLTPSGPVERPLTDFEDTVKMLKAHQPGAVALS